MTPADMTAARATLGKMWGLGRPLYKSEMGRAIGSGGVDPGQSVADYEAGSTAVPGPVRNLIALYLRGNVPPDGLDCIRKG